MSLPESYKHAVFTAAGKPLTIETVPLQLPSKGEVLVKVEACGVCHSDVFPQSDAYGVGLYVLATAA